jgi:hypothetical protein
MLVALMFMGLLLAGMVQVFLASLNSWHRVDEGLTAQRALRWSLDRVVEDLQMMGYLFPPPELRTLDLAASADPRQQSAFMLEPARPIWVARGGSFVRRAPGEDPQEPLDKTADELSFVMDVPVPVRATLAWPIPGLAVDPVPDTQTDDPAESGTVWVRAARKVDLRRGDLLLVDDGRWEFAAVRAPAALRARAAAPVQVVHPEGPGAVAAFRCHHAAGTGVQFIRPLRVVRYAVVYLDLDGLRDPRHPGELVPCLVRWETGYPADRLAPPWAGLMAGRRGSWEVVAENVTGFQVDFSLDHRFPGIRGADYAGTVRKLNAAIQARTQRAEEATRPQEPFWFRKYGGLVQLTVETRTAMARGETLRHGGPPARRYRYARSTVVLSPRNFGLEGAP